jgi:biopolymer transport protein ExbB
MTLSRLLMTLLVTSILLFAVNSEADEITGEQITNLDQLLETVREQQSNRQALNALREQEFLRDKQQQAALLAEAKRAFERSQHSNQPLLTSTEANADEIARLEKRLEQQVQSMGDISATFREFAGDFAAVMKESMVTVQFPTRIESLQRLASADSQPTIEEIQTLWLLLQEEMTAAGQVVRFEAPVVAVDGTSRSVPVLRVGTFSAISERGFLRYIPETGELLSLSRQPASRYLGPARHFMDSKENLATTVIDPSRGSLLGMIGYMPGPRERIEQGGPIAKIILALGALGVLLTCWRSIYLGFVQLQVRRQLRDIDRPSPSNPLGRVMIAANSVSGGDEQLLLMKLDEAVLTEVPILERGTSLIKLLAAIAPLLGLLGTVTGMIVTFQAISLYGTGDPKLMAGGISQALVTTVLGLIVAIPLLFGHSLVASLSRSLVQRLDEQSAGVLARTVERREG